MEKTQKKDEKVRKTVKSPKKKLKNPAKVGRLTQKAKRFCQEYVKDLNATQAAVRAGYSERSAYSQAGVLMKKAEVLEEIDRLTHEIANQNQISAREIVRDLIEVKERCMQRAPVMVNVGKGEKVQMVDDEGRDVWEFDAKGANKALELLGKHVGMFVERKEVTGRNGGPLQVQASGVLLVPAEVALTDWQKSAQSIAEDLEKKMMEAIENHEKRELIEV